MLEWRALGRGAGAAPEEQAGGTGIVVSFALIKSTDDRGGKEKSIRRVAGWDRPVACASQTALGRSFELYIEADSPFPNCITPLFECAGHSLENRSRPEKKMKQRQQAPRFTPNSSHAYAH